MSPSVCSHAVLGKRHGPRLPQALTGFQTTLRILHSNAGRFWTTAHMAFHGFGTATRMLSPMYWHVQTYFRPNTGGIQKHSALLRHISFILAGFRRPRSKVWKVHGNVGIYIRKTLLCQMDAKRPRHPPPRPVRPQHRPHSKTG